jgi:hypothetical protein
MTTARFDVDVSEDANCVNFRMLVNEAEVGRASMDAAATDEVIRSLANARVLLSDVVPTDLEPNSQIETVPAPEYRVTKYGDARCLFLRHPGLGWLGYVLPAEDAQALIEALR